MDIKRTIQKIGSDTLIIITGGKEHVGSVVLAQPYLKDNTIHATCSVLNVLSHKDEEVARIYAKEYCVLANSVVCCVCGIHFDDITNDKIKEIMKWVKEDIERMKQDERRI